MSFKGGQGGQGGRSSSYDSTSGEDSFFATGGYGLDNHIPYGGGGGASYGAGGRCATGSGGPGYPGTLGGGGGGGAYKHGTPTGAGGNPQKAYGQFWLCRCPY